MFTIERLTPDGTERTARLLRSAIAVKNAGWRDTYSGWLSAEYLDRQDAALDSTAAAWLAALEDGRLLPTWVAIAGDERVVGLAGANPAAQGHDRGAMAGGSDDLDVEMELAVLYVDAASRGTGVATALAEAAIGDASACLWVLEDNPRARAFYAKIGFEADGAAEDLPQEWNGAREIRMVRR